MRAGAMNAERLGILRRTAEPEAGVVVEGGAVEGMIGVGTVGEAMTGGITLPEIATGVGAEVVDMTGLAGTYVLPTLCTDSDKRSSRRAGGLRGGVLCSRSPARGRSLSPRERRSPSYPVRWVSTALGLP